MANEELQTPSEHQGPDIPSLENPSGVFTRRFSTEESDELLREAVAKERENVRLTPGMLKTLKRGIYERR